MYHQPPAAARRALVCALALVLALAVAGAAAPGRAAAAPAEPTLNLAQLQALLDSSPTGTVSGYFLTVDKGSHIARIPMTVDAIEENAGPDGALILFQADMSDPVMAAIGNIASGMSGSPLYVPDGGTDKLTGALSYGDIFTLKGFGQATPIEYMSAIEDKYPSSTATRNAQTAATAGRTYSTTLRQPVAVAGGAVDRIVVAPSAAVAAATAHPAGTLVFAPMESALISGLPYGSRAYKALADAFGKRGLTVRGGPTGYAGSSPQFTAPLQGGSSVVSMYAVGDFYSGWIGTVTYINGQRLMAFGHPIDWIGATSEYLCNFRIDGIWADSMAAYKVGTLGAVRGTFTQDRGSGVGGRLDQVPAQVPITAHASVTTDATRTADGASYLTQFWADSSFQLGSSLAASAAVVPVYRASDVTMLPGSAATISTVKVTDGTNHYTVRVANLWDDAADTQYVAAQDIAKIVGTLEANPDGIAPAIIESVDFRADVTSARRRAKIVDVSLTGGLHAGTNTLNVTVYVNGSTKPNVIAVPLVVPADVAPTGSLVVTPAVNPDSSYGASSSTSGRSISRVTDTRLTLAQTVDALNAAPTNDMVRVSFLPGAESSWPSDVFYTDQSTQVIGTAHSGWVVGGSVTKQVKSMDLRAVPAAVKKNKRVTLRGSIVGLNSSATVRIHRRYLGTTTTKLVGTVTASQGSDGAVFAWHSGKMAKGAVFTATWDGNDTVLGASASVMVPLRRH